MAEAWGWRAAFYFFAIPGFVVALLAWHLREPERGLQDRRHQNLAGAPARESPYDRLPVRRAYREIVRIPTFTIALVSSGVSSFFLGGISVWTVTFLIREHGMTVSQASATLGLFALGALVGSISAGFAADRLVARGIRAGRIYVAGVLRIVTFAALFPAFATGNTAVMLILFTVGAAALTGAQPVLNAVRADVLHPKLRGRGNALDSVTQNMAEAASPILFGFFSDLISLRAAFLILIPLMLLGGILLVALGPRFYPRDEEAMLRRVADEGEPGGTVAGADGAAAATPAAEALLEVRGVDFSYGPLQVLFGVDLDVPSGASVALLGPNGAGKTTLLKCISGHLEPEAGSIRFDGIDLTGVPPEDRVRLGITLIAGGRSTFPTLSVAENLWMGAYHFTRSRRLVEERLDSVLDIFPPLRPRLGQAAGTLSGGEQQMMVLGRALMAGPRLLLVDELSMGLAPVVTEELLGVVEGIGRMGTTMLVVEQSVSVALRVGDQIYFMEKGEARHLGTRAALRRKKGDLGRLMVLGRGSGA
jgi:ABC-type branched-subunit amino acid transport system ATPase component